MGGVLAFLRTEPILRSEPIWHRLAGQGSEDRVFDGVVEGFLLDLLGDLASVQEFAVVLVIAALGRGGVALEHPEHIASLGCQARGDAGIGTEGDSVRVEDEVEGGGFEAIDADEAPAGFDHAVHEERLVFAAGLEIGAEECGDGVELGFVLVWQEEEAGGESVIRCLNGRGHSEVIIQRRFAKTNLPRGWLLGK